MRLASRANSGSGSLLQLSFLVGLGTRASWIPQGKRSLTVDTCTQLQHKQQSIPSPYVKTEATDVSEFVKAARDSLGDTP